jgi:hypothetical protein
MHAAVLIAFLAIDSISWAQQPWVHSFTPLRELYVAPTGSGAGTSRSDPMSLDSALSSARAGDLIWLLEGNYRGTLALSNDGTKEQPIVYRAFPGHHVTIIGSIVQKGAYNWIWGLEITDPDGIGDSDGIYAEAAGLHAINNYIHHNFDHLGIGAWNKGPDHVYYGNIIHSAGKGNGEPTRNWHGTYTQNTFSKYGWKYFVNNVLIDNDANSAFNFHAYGECRTCEPILTGFHVEKNIVANRRFLIGGYNKPVKNVVVKENYFYGVSPQFGYRRPAQAELMDNYIARGGITTNWFWGDGDGTSPDYIKPKPNVYTGNTVILPGSGNHIECRTSGYDSGRIEGVLPFDSEDIFDSNTYAGESGSFGASLEANNVSVNAQSLAEWQAATTNAGNPFDKNSRVIDLPTEPKVVLIPNEYEPRRAHLAIYNWDKRSNVAADLSSLMGDGSSFTIHRIKDIFGAVVISGIYTGPISLSTDGAEFSVFLVQVVGSSQRPTAPAPPTGLRMR